jgi:hypothetical protein
MYCVVQTGSQEEIVEKSVRETEELNTDRFMDYLIAALVVRGKKYINIRGAHTALERRCMRRLHHFMELLVEVSKRKDMDWKYFIVHLRNELSPSPIGSYDGTRTLFLRKMSTYVSISFPECHTYDLAISDVTAQSMLKNAHPHMRKLAECAANAYVGRSRHKGRRRIDALHEAF